MSCEGEHCVKNITGKTSLEILQLPMEADIEQIYERSIQMATPYHPQNGGERALFIDGLKFRILMHSTYNALFALFSQTCCHKQCLDLENLLKEFSCLTKCLLTERHKGYCNELFYLNILGNFHLTYKQVPRKMLRQMQYFCLTPAEVRDLGQFYDELITLQEDKCDDCKQLTKRGKGGRRKDNAPPKVHSQVHTKAGSKEQKKVELDNTTMDIILQKVNKAEVRHKLPNIRLKQRVLSPGAEEEIESQRRAADASEAERRSRYLEEENRTMREAKKMKKIMKKQGIAPSALNEQLNTGSGSHEEDVKATMPNETLRTEDNEEEPRYKVRPLWEIDGGRNKMFEKPKEKMSNPIEEGIKARSNVQELQVEPAEKESEKFPTVIDTIVGNKSSIDVIEGSTMSFAEMLRKSSTLSPKQDLDRNTQPEYKMESLGNVSKSHRIRYVYVASEDPQTSQNEEESNSLFEASEFPKINESQSESKSKPKDQLLKCSPALSAETNRDCSAVVAATVIPQSPSNAIIPRDKRKKTRSARDKQLSSICGKNRTT